MRATIALDDDLAEKLQEIAHKRRESFRKVVNETLRRGLSAQAPRPARTKAFKADTFESPFRAGVDPFRLNQLVDDLVVPRDDVLNRTLLTVMLQRAGVTTNEFIAAIRIAHPMV